MNDAFSKSSQKTIEFARNEAFRLQNDFIGTEHLLLGLIRQESSGAIDILTSIGIDLNKLRESLEEVVQPPSGDAAIIRTMTVGFPLTARSKKVLEISGQEARALKSEMIEPEHLLLALLKEEEGVAAQVLGMYDFDYSDAYLELTGAREGNPDQARRRIEFPFSEAFRNALQNAHSEAARLDSSYIGITHLALGLISLEEDPALDIVKHAGVDLAKLKTELEKEIFPDPNDKLRIDLGRRRISFISSVRHPVLRRNQYADEVIVSAYWLARERELQEINTVCLLLAILRRKENRATKTLSKYGLNYENVLHS